MNNFDNVTPKKIGNFNVPKNVIECKVDTLTFLEILLRKNICTWEEIEEIREVVVMHLNVIFPELQLSYSTPAPLKDQAPLTPPEQPQKPLYYTPSPTEFETVNNSEPEKQEQPQTPQQATQSTGTNPLYHTNQPKILSANKPNPSAGIKPINNNPVQAPQTGDNSPQPQAGANNPNPAPKPLIPNAGPPKILNAPPRKKI